LVQELSLYTVTGGGIPGLRLPQLFRVASSFH
jgi:hypothetical protein